MGSLAGIRRVLFVLLGGALFATYALADSVVTQGSRAASQERCVAPTDEIRRNHMDYLKHDRDKTVREGDREVPNSLAACVDCHAEKTAAGEYQPINAEGQFCSTCHQYVAVSLTCFQCHRKTPESAQESTAARLPEAPLHSIGLDSTAGMSGSTIAQSKLQGD